MPKPETGKASHVKLTNAGGDPTVLVMREVTSPEAATPDADNERPRARSPGQNEYNAWLEALKSAAEIERREELL